ncbi:hypothetical protein HQ531_04815 [bacterium]|nr:hypothetical protein [bacterium]
MFTTLRLIILFSLPFGLIAEGVSWNIGLVSQVGKGEQLGVDYDYLENFITGSIEYGNWYLDLSFESSTPPEYGFEYQGFDRIFLSYIGNAQSLEIGDISAVFGRGLALNLDEDRAIDFDNEIKGLRLTSSFLDIHELDIVAGINNGYRFYSPSSNLRLPDGEANYELAGAEATINSTNGIWTLAPYFIASRLNSDHVWRTLDPSLGAVSNDTVSQTMHSIQSGWSQSIYGNSWDVYLEYNQTWKAFDYPLITPEIIDLEDGLVFQNEIRNYDSQGNAFNLQLNWFPEWFTSMFEYKRYLNGPESAGDKRNPLLLATKPLPWQLGPTALRQHDISLLGNVTHPIDYGDEVGWNFELRKNINEYWIVIFNGAQSSQARDTKDLDQKDRFWPDRSKETNPWEEYFTEIEYSGESISQRMFIAYTRSVLSGQSAAEIYEHITLVPAYLSWHPIDNLVLSTVLELQFSSIYGEIYGGEMLEEHNYNSTHFIASSDFLHKYSTSLIWDTNNDHDSISGEHIRQHWVSAEISIKPVDGMWVRASYGKEKGGVRCTGGVCRVLNPFKGFRMTLEWRL